MSKHTPGPWAFVQGGSGDFPTWNVRIGTRGFITLPPTASMETMDADARLIAVAPKLLEALIAVRDRFFPADQPERDRDLMWDPVNAVIAKAEGRA